MLTFCALADTAIAALTCFPASIIGAAFHTIFMSDSAKMIVNHRAFSLSRESLFPPRLTFPLSPATAPSMAEEISMLNESRGFPTISRAITRETVYRDMNGMGSTKS